MTGFAKGRIVADLTTPTSGDHVASALFDTAGNFFTSTLNGAKRSLDVHVSGSAGQYAEDSAHTTADIGSLGLAVRRDANTSLVDTDGDYAPLQVNALGALKVAVSSFTSNYEYAEDSAHASAAVGAFVLAVRNDAGTALAGADGDYIPFTTDSSGRLRALATTAFQYAEDAAHTTGDIGSFSLSVRSDTEVALAGTTGDYAPFTTNAFGALRVTSKADSTVLQQLVSVTTTATALPTTALANRKSIMIQAQTAPIWVGSGTVTASGATSGIKLAQGDVLEADAGPGCAIFGIASSGAKDAILLEFA